MVFIHQWWFSPEYKGALKAEIPFNEVLKISVPYWLMLALSYVCNLIDFGPVFSPTSLAIAGLYMIRPAVRDDIDAIWEKKWSIS